MSREVTGPGGAVVQSAVLSLAVNGGGAWTVQWGLDELGDVVRREGSGRAMSGCECGRGRSVDGGLIGWGGTLHGCVGGWVEAGARIAMW